MDYAIILDKDDTQEIPGDRLAQAYVDGVLGVDGMMLFEDDPGFPVGIIDHLSEFAGTRERAILVSDRSWDRPRSMSGSTRFGA